MTKFITVTVNGSFSAGGHWEEETAQERTVRTSTIRRVLRSPNLAAIIQIEGSVGWAVQNLTVAETFDQVNKLLGATRVPQVPAG